MGSVGRSIGGFVEDFTGINTGGDSAADRATRAQQTATNSANDMQRYMFEQQRADQEPWRQTGTTALKDLAGGDFQRDFTMADFEADPGYQFRMAEGAKALERSAAARGGLNSGATLKALTKYGQDFASNEYNNAYNRFNADRDRRFNRLSSLAGLGQTANTQVGQAGQNYANNVSNNTLNMGNAQAAGAINQGNRRVAFGNQLMENASTGMFMASDERLKTNVEMISKEDLAEMKKHLKPYKFNYVDEALGEGDWVGVMAQDLEKSKLGRTLVETDANGFKRVNMKKAVSVFLASMATEG